MLLLFNNIKKLRPIFSKQDKQKFLFILALMFCASFLEAVAMAAMPLYVSILMKPSSLANNQWLGQWFTDLPDELSVQIMLWASLALIAFIILKTIFMVFVYFVQSKVVIGQSVRLRDRMFCTYQSAPYEWHLQRSSSEIQRNIQEDTNSILSGIIMPLLDLSMSIIMTAFIVIVLVINATWVTLIGLLIIGGGIFFMIRMFQSQLIHSGEVIRYEGKQLIQAIQQGFGALIDARINGSEEYLSDVHKQSALRQGKVRVERDVIQKMTPHVVEIVSILGLLVILLLLFQVESSLETILPLISLLLIAIVRLKQLTSRIANTFNTMNSAQSAIPDIVRDINELDVIIQSRKQSSIRSDIGRFKSLCLDKVTYTYPSTSVPAVLEITLELKLGESIAFVGSTGCGKSTLCNLILGLLVPQSGCITVNGQDISTDPKAWWRHLGYIPQSIFLLDDTISANIAFGISPKEVDIRQLNTALRSARLDEFIETLPEGINTVVGERGVRLSGGQRQRLGIARALYFNPEVLVMDEATSALDNKTEMEVMEAIQELKKGRTIIMIAHRLSTVADCDRLYYMKDGRIESTGSYQEVTKASSGFREMVSLM